MSSDFRNPNRGLVRPMTEEDLDCIREWRNHPDIVGHMLQSGTIAAIEHRAWFERSQTMDNRHLLVFETDAPCGFVQFNSAPGSDVAEWGFYAAPEAPKGTGTLLGKAALDYAFDTLKLHKVFGQVLSSNRRSLRFHERLGFTAEGVLREHQLRDDQYLDLHCFGLLRDEWHANNPDR